MNSYGSYKWPRNLIFRLSRLNLVVAKTEQLSALLSFRLMLGAGYRLPDSYSDYLIAPFSFQNLMAPGCIGVTIPLAPVLMLISLKVFFCSNMCLRPSGV